VTVAVKNTATRPARRVPFIVRISPSCSRGFRAQVQAPAGGELKQAHAAAGLLFGHVNDREVEVESVRPFAFYPDETAAADTELLGRDFDECLAASKTDAELGSFDLIGWYCIRSDGKSGLLDREIEFHNRHFRRISDIALILSPEEQVDRLNLYTRWANIPMSAERHRYGTAEFTDGIAAAESVTATMRARVNDDYQRRVYQILGSMHEAQRTGKSIAFPAQTSGFDAADPIAKGERPASDRHASPSDGAASPDHSLQSEPPLVDEPPLFRFGSIARHAAIRSIPTNRKLWITCASFLVIAGILIFSWPYLRRVPLLVRKRIPAAVAARDNSAALGMRVQAQGDALLVSWDRQSEMIRSAESAVLEISDGSRYREIHLDSNEIANGSLLYRPASSDVALRLRLSRKHGSTTSESIRVLDGSNMPSGPNSIGKAHLNAVAGTHPLIRAAPTTASNQATLAAARSVPRDLRAELRKPPGRDTAEGVPQPGRRGSGTGAPASREAPSSEGRQRENQRAMAVKATGSQHPPEAATARSTRATNPARVVEIPEAGQMRTAPRPSRVYVPPRPIKQVMPSGVSGGTVIFRPVQIEVQVRIDETGRVSELHLTKVSEQNESLARSALTAAKEWIFQPATIDGKNVPSDHIIEFRFTPEAR
jgi:hypothetical protein